MDVQSDAAGKIGGIISRQPFSFWSLLHTHRKAGCADKRDRVYSLLGLVAHEHKFAVDYNEDVTDLFWRVAEYLNVGQSPELVDILRVALLEDDAEVQWHRDERATVNPWGLYQSILKNPNTRVCIPIRRVTTMKPILERLRTSVKCNFDGCRRAPRMRCTRDDLLLCTNTHSDEPSTHGCIHAVAYPVDKPAAEPFEIRLMAHHDKRIAATTMVSIAVKVFDVGTDTWIGISTWSSLQRAVNAPDLDRTNRLKLSVPAAYAMMIWFGIHPSQLDGQTFLDDTGLPSAHHALPRGTKITKDAVELPKI